MRCRMFKNTLTKRWEFCIHEEQCWLCVRTEAFLAISCCMVSVQARWRRLVLSFNEKKRSPSKHYCRTPFLIQMATLNLNLITVHPGVYQTCTSVFTKVHLEELKKVYTEYTNVDFYRWLYIPYYWKLVNFHFLNKLKSWKRSELEAWWSVFSGTAVYTISKLTSYQYSLASITDKKMKSVVHVSNALLENIDHLMNAMLLKSF